jgi:predicted MPP superfamily phosphohydrolase
MSAIACVILILGAAGHVVLWVALVNRIHALGIHRVWVDLLTLLCGIMLAALPLGIAAVLAGIISTESGTPTSIIPRTVWTYLTLCAAVLIVTTTQRAIWLCNPERRGALLSNHTEAVTMSDTNELLSPGIPTWLGKLPGNEVLNVCVQHRTIIIPRLTHSSEPLRIAQLTDLHMSGRLTRPYFERVVEETNALNPDFVAITGDIVERQQCIDWLPQTLGRLKAPAGVYFVLGNHDLHVDVNRLKAALSDLGLIHLGADCRELTIRGMPVVLGGNERPWFKTASNFGTCQTHDESGLPLRILLAHSPDEFGWAQAQSVDLMLAGHLHGGQVRVPMFGAIFSPSLRGVRYASGVFSAAGTVMHVSSGTGSLTPLRYYCAPEISLLTLAPRSEQSV